MGVDGISLFLILLTTLLTPLAILASWSIHDRLKEYFIFMLLLETGMIGVFASLDLFLFYVFWEVMLIPMYFLIGVWGGERRIYAAMKFVLYTMVGSVLMLVAIICAVFHARRRDGNLHVQLSADSVGDRIRQDGRCTPTSNCGCFWRSSSHSRSKFRCSPFTRGFLMRTWKRRLRDRSCWRAFAEDGNVRPDPIQPAVVSRTSAICLRR